MEGADFSQRCPISVPLRSQRSPGLSHRVFSIWDFCLPFEAAPRIYSFLRQLFRCTAPHNVPRDNKPGSAVSLVSQNVDAVLFSGNSQAPPPQLLCGRLHTNTSVDARHCPCAAPRPLRPPPAWLSALAVAEAFGQSIFYARCALLLTTRCRISRGRHRDVSARTHPLGKTSSSRLGRTR